MKNINRLKGGLEMAGIFLLDLLFLTLIFKLSVHIRTEILPHLDFRFPLPSPSGSVVKLWWVFLIWVFFYYYEGLYTKRYSFWDEVKALWKTAFFSTVGVFAIASVGKLGNEISRTVIILMGSMAVFALPPLKMTSKSFLRKAGLLRRRVLILGAGETGRLICKALRKEPNYGYEVIGYLDDDLAKVGKSIDGVKVHRGVGLAARYLGRCNVTDLVIAMPGAGKEKLQGLINDLQHKVDRILFVPDIFGLAVVGTTLQHFFQEQAFALEVKNNLAQPINYFTKRVFDYVVGLVLLMVLSVPLLVISALVRLTSKGPAIYMQERVGKRGEPFMCYKFRTMYHDAEERLQDILREDPVARSEWEKYWKLKDDPRVTAVGRFLRRTSLDELPQILNVLKGQMSLVGPRPYLLRELGFITDYEDTLLTVIPGITGLWQVSGRSNTGYDYRIALDSWYVRNWNLWLDLVIMLKTVRVVFNKEGAC
jgi:undecaprenyl-phosphate galactose phosphotransferase